MMEEHKFERGCYLNSEEVQKWLFGLGYSWFRNDAEADYLEEKYVYTNWGGDLTCGSKEPKEEDLPLKTMPVEEEPHPYRHIIERITDKKPPNWEEAVSWLGNIGKGSKFYNRDLEPQEGVVTAFNWKSTPQGSDFWDVISEWGC